MSDLNHLKLTGWPFKIVPDDECARIWADRTSVREQIDRLVWNWCRRDQSYICVLWGTLGAGKSHMQKYLFRQLSGDSKIMPIYALMPKEIRNFLDVYKAIVGNMDLDILAKMLIQADHNSGGPLKVARDIFPAFPDAATVLRDITSDIGPRRRLAEMWLKGGKTSAAQLRELSINSSLKTTDDCVAMLGGIVNLVRTAGKCRLLVMLDECQRVWDFKRSVGRDINIGLQTWFDASPNHLILLLSFKCGDESHVRRACLSEDLQDRVTWPAIALPPLNKTDAMEFVRALLEHFRSEKVDSPWYPFPEPVVDTVIGYLTGEVGATPRVIMRAFDAMLSEIDYQVSVNSLYKISVMKALEIVKLAVQTLRDDED